MTKVGLFGIGLDTYWAQFDGLLDNLKAYQEQIKNRIAGYGVEVADAGMVDNPVKAREAADYLKSQDVEIVFLYVSTYALSSTVLPVAQKLKVPVVILNLQPVAELDYEAFNKLGDRGKMTGVWLEHCQACSVPEIASVFNRSGIQYDFVTGYLQDEEAWREIEAWTEAARVAAAMRNNRLGVLGHYYWRNAGCLYRHDQTIGCFWHPHRTARNVRTEKIPRRSYRCRSSVKNSGI